MADVASGKVVSADCVLMRSRIWCVGSHGTHSHRYLNFVSINVGLPSTWVVEVETPVMGPNISSELQKMKVGTLRVPTVSGLTNRRAEGGFKREGRRPCFARSKIAVPDILFHLAALQWIRAFIVDMVIFKQ